MIEAPDTKERHRNFAGWVKTHTADLLRYASARVKEKAVAEDLVQLTFVAAWETMDRFAGDSSPRTWLFAILKHKLADHYRRVYREGTPVSGIDLSNDEEPGRYFTTNGHWDGTHAPAEAAAFDDEDQHERLDRALRHCLDALPPHWRSAVEMKYLMNKDSAKIQETLGLSETNYWQQLHRAKLKLRACIQSRLNERSH